MTLDLLKIDIARTMRKLEKQSVAENFGQEEVRRLRDKYSGLATEYYSEYIKPFREQQERLKNQRKDMENALNSL